MKIPSSVEDSTISPSPCHPILASRFDDASSDDVDVAGNKKKDVSGQNVPMQIVGFGCEKGQCCRDAVIKLQQQLLEAEKHKFYLSRELDVANHKLHRAELEILRMKEQVSNSHEQKTDKDREGFFADMLKSELKIIREEGLEALEKMAEKMVEKLSKDNEAQNKKKSLSISKRLSYLEGKLTTEIKSEMKTLKESSLKQQHSDKNLESVYAGMLKSELQRIREKDFEEMAGKLSDCVEEQFKQQELFLLTWISQLKESISKQVKKGEVEIRNKREKEDVVSSPVSGRTSDLNDLPRGIIERDSSQIKLLVIGDSGVGKSSLLRQFYCFSNKLSPFDKQVFKRYLDENPRSCLDKHKSLTIDLDGKTVKLEIRDDFGAEHLASNYRGADGIICVYDVTDSRTLKTVNDWMEKIEMYAPEDFIKLLIGNKCDRDLFRRRGATFYEGVELTDLKGWVFIETSAKTPTNVKRALQLIALQMRKYQSVDSGQ